MVRPGDTVDYTYNALDQLVSETHTGSAPDVTYDYDPRGNLAHERLNGTPISTYTWDARDRMTGAVVASTTVNYAYNADGLRTRQQIGSDTTKYLWDELSSYGDVVVEMDGTNAVTASYVLGGNGIISQTRGGTTSYFMSDAQGSTRALTTDSATPTISQSYSYDAFGELLAPPSTLNTTYLYTGQQYDSATSLYSLRARYYDTGIGRFLSRDTWAINHQNPMELNRYVYGAGNPIVYNDPSGHMLEYGGLTAQERVEAGTLVGGAAGFTGSTLFFVAARLGACGSDLQSQVAVMPFEEIVAGIAGATIKGAAIGFVTSLVAEVLPEVAIAWGILEFVNLGNQIMTEGERLCTMIAMAGGALAAAAAMNWYEHNTPYTRDPNDPNQDYVVNYVDTTPEIINTEVYHGTRSPELAESILRGIDRRRLDTDNRFGQGFHVSSDLETSAVELRYHNVEMRGAVRFELNVPRSRMLDLTVEVNRIEYNYQLGVNDYSITQPIALRARQEGYVGIIYPSERGSGTNYVIFDEFDTLLQNGQLVPLN